MKALLIISFILVGMSHSFTQNVGIGTNSPDASAKLEVSSTNSGVLIPNINISDASAAAPITSPATGLLVWNTNASITGGYGIGYYYWNGSSWTKLATEPVASNTVGDVKHGFQAADHSGWVQLDGRLISTLSAAQQTAAAALGFTGNLPDATDKVLKQKGALNNTGGSNTVIVAQTNLPDVNFTGTAAGDGLHNHTASSFSAGNHNHTFRDYGYSSSGTGVNLDDSSGSFSSPSEVTMDDNDYNTTQSGGNHSHLVSIGQNGIHTHSVSVSSGGSDTPLNIENAYLSTNVFIYLGL